MCVLRMLIKWSKSEISANDHGHEKVSHFDKILTQSQTLKIHSEQVNTSPEYHFESSKLTFIQDFKNVEKVVKM